MNFTKLSFNRIFFTIGFSLITFTIGVAGNSSISVNALNNSEAQSLSCSLSLGLTGSGLVTMTSTDGQAMILQQEANQLQLPCAEEVTLTAEPYARWRFDHWQGVSEADRQLPTITLRAPAQITAVFVPRAATYETVETPFYDRGGELVTRIERLEPLWRPLTDEALADGDPVPPVIEVWYGDTQNFGQPGTPQEYIDILGNVSDDDGDVSSLTYELNNDGVARVLSYGGSGSLNDTRRLINQGDFIINFDKDDLLPLPDSNEFVITVEDSIGLQDVYTGTVTYDASTIWPIPYAIDWTTANSIQEKAQIVDGKWELNDFNNDGLFDGVRLQPGETGYDRIIAIGEGSFDLDDGSQWTEFEATVPVTIHGYDEENGFEGNQVAPAIGVVARWQGHTTTPVNCEQPECGYTPVGAASWYQWDRKDREKAVFSIWTKSPSNKVEDDSGFQLEFGKTYFWRVRVENSAGPEGMYDLWVWPADKLEPGPADLHISAEGEKNGLYSGSLLLLSHHVDLTFGDVQICALDGCPGPVITEPLVEPAVYDATVTWKTDRRATSRIDYWSDPADVKTMSVDGYTTDHAVQLENLEAETNYEFQIYSVDRFGNESATDVDTFTTEPVPIETFTLTVSASGAGTVSIDLVKTEYDFGDQVTLTAVPKEEAKSYFAGWSGDVGGDENPLLLVINEDTEVQATFDQYIVGDYASYLPTTLSGQ